MQTLNLMIGINGTVRYLIKCKKYKIKITKLKMISSVGRKDTFSEKETTERILKSCNRN